MDLKVVAMMFLATCFALDAAQAGKYLDYLVGRIDDQPIYILSRAFDSMNNCCKYFLVASTSLPESTPMETTPEPRPTEETTEEGETDPERKLTII